MALYIKTLIALFSLINPLSAIPVFLSLTHGMNSLQLSKTIRRTSLYVAMVCIISFLFGEYLLEFFGITIHALKLAGGIIISRSGFLLLNSKHKKDIKNKIKDETLMKEDISFSPLAMPLLSGPGSISLLINTAILNKAIQEKLIIVLVCLSIGLIIFLIFTTAPRIFKYLGNAGLSSMSKIMGLIVLSIGIQMMITTIFNLIQLQ